MVKLVLLLVGLFCYSVKCDLRIVHGQYAKLGQFPYQVSIQTNNSTDYEHYCAGGIIARKWILTAAHCLLQDMSKYRIVSGIVGLDNSSRFLQVRKPIRFEIHPDFQRAQNYNLAVSDYGLIEVDSFRFDNYTKPVKLANCVYKPKGNASLAGWGGLDIAGLVRPNALKYTTVFIPNQKTCRTYYPEFDPKVHFCTNPVRGEGACFGDEGGPLVQKGKFVGVASKVDYPCATNTPTIFAKVSEAYKYIKSIIGK